MTDHQIDHPAWHGIWPPNWPMGLTMLRLILLPLFLYLLLADARTEEHPLRWWALGVFAIMALTDKLDGYLARRLNQTSKLGTILDPLADKLLIACSVILLSFDWIAPPGYQIPLLVVLAVYGKDVLVVLGTLLLLGLIGKVQISARLLGKLSTAFQLALVMATLIAPDLQRLAEPLAVGLTRGLWWIVSILAILATADYILQGARQFARARRDSA